MKNRNVLLVGVGGQGTILAAKILSSALLDAGYDIKMSEIHGMSQRGGSVSTQVRFGEKIYSPVIAKGEADFICAFEKLEALRYAEYIREGGTIIVNDYKISPLPVLTSDFSYPENIIEKLERIANLEIVDAAKIAENLGNQKVMNIVLLGRLSRLLDMEKLDFEKAIKKNISEKLVELNLKAFKA
ncbi:MAG: indolepyruvate oxidoreductase subunit beta [Clostridiales Family XIII bacterium]|jgi:indolepyruvate ferredoxin oxidoreductase beta subunit|nr:indolepyruvate oxidoreductase subunit beta [Clostridiales Family XIII bacterium]